MLILEPWCDANYGVWWTRNGATATVVNLLQVFLRTLLERDSVSGRFVLKIGDHLENAETKKYYTERNFSEVAPRYDFITKVLSVRRDGAWKRTLISLLPCHDSPVCIDLACGTGDIAFLLVANTRVAASPELTSPTRWWRSPATAILIRTSVSPTRIWDRLTSFPNPSTSSPVI